MFKMKNVSCGLVLYDFLNYICCAPCIDKICLNGKKASIFKWIILIIISIVTYTYVEEYNNYWEDWDFL